jgi:hypothetical protein
MKSAVAEIARISRSLPPRNTAQLLEFARALQDGRENSLRRAPKSGDAEWKRLIDDARPRPKLAAKLSQLKRLAEKGKTEPMDWARL